jgi:hypothetical protein
MNGVNCVSALFLPAFAIDRYYLHGTHTFSDEAHGFYILISSLHFSRQKQKQERKTAASIYYCSLTDDL